jgi:hypothetical protein
LIFRRCIGAFPAHRQCVIRASLVICQYFIGVFKYVAVRKITANQNLKTKRPPQTGCWRAFVGLAVCYRI